MSRITIDVLERQAEHMGLKVLESDFPALPADCIATG